MSGEFVIGLPPVGDDTVEQISDYPGLTLRHGSSLFLMSSVGQFLNNSNEFASIDPSEDWKKWESRTSDFSLYYCAVLDDATGQVCGALRAVTDGHPIPTAPHKRRIIIDYVTVAPSHRGRGLASMLVQFVLNVACMSEANVFVLALEDSCVYWMSQAFLLEQNAYLNARLNIFPDCHLLRHEHNQEDAGDAADLAMQVQFGNGGGVDRRGHEDDDSDSGSDEDDDDDDDDDEEGGGREGRGGRIGIGGATGREGGGERGGGQMWTQNPPRPQQAATAALQQAPAPPGSGLMGLDFSSLTEQPTVAAPPPPAPLASTPAPTPAPPVPPATPGAGNMELDFSSLFSTRQSRR